MSVILMMVDPKIAPFYLRDASDADHLNEAES